MFCGTYRINEARSRRRTLALLVVLVLAVSLAACGTPSRRHGGGDGVPVEGGSVSFALPPSATPNWILPIGIPGYLATYNSAIQSTMYPSLYIYDKSGGELDLDEKASAALPPRFSADGRAVTITLKDDLSWSTGEAVTTRDVEFWFNLIKANKKEWGGYSEGRIPDDIVSFSTVSDRTFRLKLDKAYNQDWFTANQLTNITPLPQASWDKTSATGTVGDYDRDQAGASKVFDFLVGQAKQLATYDTNPLWKVVDGPFELRGFTMNGQVTLAKNPHYTGEDAAHLDTVTLRTFTSSAAEYNVLLAGGVDYGYVPTSDLGQKQKLRSLGYRIDPWRGWAITYIPYNFNNPELGDVFAQDYVRQAIQRTVDQRGIAHVIWRDTATPGYGPVPQGTGSKYLSPVQRKNPYPFDVGKAKNQLLSHGWRIGDDGVAFCAEPGDGRHRCGSGIEPGTRLSMDILSESGSNETDDTMQELKSSLSEVGIELTITERPLNSVLAATTPCEPDEASCGWQLSFFGTQGSWYYPADPSGEQIFATSGASNLGSYSDAKADRLVRETTLAGSGSAMPSYSAYLAKDLPVIWLPNPAYQVSAIDSALHGVSQDPMAGMHPQRWYRTK